MRRLFAAGVLTCWMTLSAAAQGLVWSLPADGAWVLFQGEYTQTDIGGRAADETNKKDVETTWNRELTIKSVGVEQAEYEGETTACRWIEFVLIDSKPDQDGRPVPGPAGKVIYKVLVPEKAILGKPHDDRGVFNEYLPIVRGVRKVGNLPETPLDGGVLQFYPALTLLMPYREYQSAGSENPDSPLADSADKLTAELSIESRGVRLKPQEAGDAPLLQIPYSTRVVNKATLWRTDSVPFGLAGWEVTQARSRKGTNAPRSDFVETSRVVSKMVARDSGTDAQSELP